MHESEQKFEDKFSQREIASVVQVVDTNLRGADVIIGSVTPENLGDLIEIFIKFRKERRQTLNEDCWEDLSVADTVEDKRKRNCQPHAIQCDIQGAQDATYIINKLTGSENSKENLDIQKIVLFFEREVKMRLNLAEFHRVDIARRIGDFKKDGSYYINEKDRFAKALPVLFDLTEDFENFNREKMAFLSQEDLKEVQDDLSQLHKLSISNFQDLESSFYEEVCERLGRLIYFDWDMNIADLQSSAENI